MAVGPEVSHDFDQAVSNGEAWERNQHRSYFRAVHGQANTLRKMGRYREALAKYMKLAKMNPGFHRYVFVCYLQICPSSV